MKSVYVLVSLLVLALALNDMGLKQGQIFDEQTTVKLEESYIGRVVLKMLDLRFKAQQFDFSKLFDALDELDESVRERMNLENDAYELSRVGYLTDQSFFNNQVTQFESEIATHNVDISDLSSSLESLEKTLETKRNELSETQKLRGNLENQIKVNEKTFNAQLGEYNDVVMALDQAIELVGSIRDGSFVEIERVNILHEQMTNGFQSLKHRRVMYAPLIRAFLQVCSPSFADQEMVGKVLRLLQNLRDSLNQSRVYLTQAFEAERTENQNLLAELNQKETDLTNTTIPQLQSDIETQQGEINTKKQLVSDAQRNLKAAQDNLQNNENKWVERSNENRKLVDGYNNELVIVAAAVTHLQNSGIRR